MTSHKEKESMVIGWLPGEQQDGNAASAWARVETVQRKKSLPCLLVPQPAHAVLAGELAAGLLSSAFGELPPEIVLAIQMHDTGWGASDAQQIQRLRSGAQGSNAAPESFIAISAAEMVEAWTASVDTVEELSQVGALIVSRHFSLLAQIDRAPHQRFLEAERSRQRRLDSRITCTPADLERWTAALGFCDLVSLALLSGLTGEVDLALAHPASSQAQTAPRVKMQIHGDELRFTPQTVRAGSVLSIQALKHPVPVQGARAETFLWEVQ